MKRLYIILVLIISILCTNGCALEMSTKEEEFFTVLVTDVNAKVIWGNDAVTKEMKRRTGMNLKIEVLDTDMQSKLESMMSLGEYPDMILSVDNDIISSMAANNLLVPLDDYITEDTNIYNVFGNKLDYMRCEVDDKIYGVNRDFKEIPSISEAPIFVQYEVLKYFNYPDVTNMTLDDLFIMLEEYKKENKYINNVETIGLSFWGDSYGLNVTLNNPALRTGGYQNDGKYIVDDDFKVTYGMRTEEAKGFFEFLNKMNSAGLLDREGLVQHRSQFVEKVTSGAVLAVLTQSWDLGDSEAILRNNQMGNRCYIPLPIKQNQYTDISQISAYDVQGTWKSVITSSCKNPDAAFEFFDLMWSDEMQILANWGVEGIHYDIIDGVKVLRDNIIQEAIFNSDWKSDTGLTIFGMWSYGSNVKDENGEYYNYFTSDEFELLTADAETKNILEKYNIKSFKDLCPPLIESNHTFVWKLNLDSSSKGAYAEQYIDEVLRRVYLPKAVFANSEEEFESNWKEFIREINKTDIDLREQEISDRLSYMKLLATD